MSTPTRSRPAVRERSGGASASMTSSGAVKSGAAPRRPAGASARTRSASASTGTTSRTAKATPGHGRKPASAAKAKAPSAGGGGSAGGPGGPGGPGARAPRGGSPRRRTAVLAMVSVLVFLLLGGRIVYVQGLDSQSLAERAISERTGTLVMPAARGAIMAADGTVLASSVSRFDIAVDQENIAKFADRERELNGAAGAAEILAPVLETTPAELLPLLEGDKRYQVIAKDVTSQVWDAVRDLGITGITGDEKSVRSYPGGALAGNVVGYYNRDGEALAGLEITYDDLMTGTDGELRYERSASNRMIPLGDQSGTQPIDGTSIVTSVVPDIQLFAQQQAATTVREHNAEWATVVVQNVKTNELLAVAEAPYADPNNPAGRPGADLSSKLFQGAVEPGSTAKIVTAAALLEEGLVDPLTPFEVADRWTAPNGERFRDSSDHATEDLTFAGIMMDSSNTGTLQAGQALTPQQRYDYLRKFGFGQPSGIGFPGETSGVLREPGDWDGRTAYAVMFGQGMTATSLQSANAMTTVVNGGVHHDDRLVTAEIAPDGTRTELPRAEGQRVISEETSAEMRKILEGVVVDGTGKNAQIPGYRVGGKTGTAQAPSADGGYDGYTASFVGAAPIEDPEIVVSVVVQRPTDGYYGGTAAAPLFQQVMAHSLRSLGVPPSTEDPDVYPREADDDQ